MNERDIRTAFQHLEEDVMTSVRTEERLEQITRRSLWIRPAFFAFAGAAAVALIVGAAVLAFRPDSEADPVPPATGGPTSVVDTTAVPTTSPQATDTVIEMPDLRAGMVVIADLSVPALVIAEDSVAYLAERVVGDGSGGVVVQVDQRLVNVTQSGEGDDLVDARDLAVEGAPATIQLQDIAVVDGSPRVIYTVTIGSGFDGYEEVWSYDLAAGTAEMLIRQDGEGDYEDTITRVSLANDLMVLTFSAPGTTYLEFYDGDGRPAEVPGPVLGPDGAFTEFDMPVFEAVLAPDGSTLAYLQIRDVTTGEDGYLFADVIIWDLVDNVEVERLEVELREGEFPAQPGRMDYDGDVIVLGRSLVFVDGPVILAPLRIAPADGAIMELDTAGAPSLIK